MKRTLKFSFLVLLLGFYIGPVLSQGLDLGQNVKLPVDSHVVIGKLDNGITYYLRHNDNPKNRIELKLAVNAGSVCEDDDQQGLAHFCEHMAFNGTDKFHKQAIVNFLESIGMKFGAEVNAYTSFDETVYRITVPTNPIQDVDTGLMILSQWAYYQSMDNTEIDKERGVIHEEWRLHQGASERMMKVWWPVLFKNAKYANRNPIGTMEVVDFFKYDVIKRFYKDWYRPDLMAVVAVGDFDVKQLEEKIKANFSQIPKAVNPRPREKYIVPGNVDPLVSIVKDKEAQNILTYIYYKHDSKDEITIGDYRTGIVHSLYNQMINERLDELTQEENPPYLGAFAGYQSLYGLPTIDVYMIVSAALNNELDRSIRVMCEENERLKKYGFLQTELDRAKKETLRGYEQSFNERYKVKSENIAAEYVRNYLKQEPIPGIVYEYEIAKKYIPEIKLEEINQLALQWITDQNMVVVLMAPDKPEITLPSEEKVLKIIRAAKTAELKPWVDNVSDKPLLAEKPAPQKIAKTEKNEVLGTTTWVLKNGVKVIIKQTDFKADQILFTAYSPGGASLYSDKDDISADIAADVVSNSGLGELNQIALQKTLSGKIVNVTPDINELTEEMNGSSSPQDLETMLEMVYMYFTQPRKDAKAYSSFMSRTKGSIENKSTNPEEVFRDSLISIMSQHNKRERPLSLQNISEADYNRVHYIYRDRFADASDFTFIFVGNIDLKKTKPLIETYLGGLPSLNRNETWKDLNITPPKGVVDQIVYKGMEPKSYIYFEFTGPYEFNFKNNLYMKAMCDMLTIALRENIREDQGGTYGISCWRQVDQYPKQKYELDIYFGCSPDNVDKLSKLVLEEIEKFKNEGPSDVNIAKVKETLLKTRETDLRENRFWLNTIKNYYFNNITDENITGFNNAVNAISKESMKEYCKKYFNNQNYARIVLKPENKK
jgi:zinc protease